MQILWKEGHYKRKCWIEVKEIEEPFQKQNTSMMKKDPNNNIDLTFVAILFVTMSDKSGISSQVLFNTC